MLCFLTLTGLAWALTIYPAAPRQGDSFTVELASLEGVTKVQAVFLGQKIKFFPAGKNSFKTVIGVPCEQKPGVYDLSLVYTKSSGKTEKVKYSVTVARTQFPIVSFWLKPAKKKLLARDVVGEDWALIEKALLKEDPRQSWDGEFIQPVTGEISMLFGTQEYINRQKRGQHRGLDIAVPTGTRVAAANNGRVVFARQLAAFGGTIVIDHGQGVHTLYFHLSKFLSSVGQKVNKGEIIALSGSSGVTSGPHLHWGLSVHNLRVDPTQWIRYVF